MRVFLAINFPDALQRRMLDATSALRQAAPDVRWVGEPLIHMTVKFLGDVDEPRIEDVRRTLLSVTESHCRMAVRFTGVGAFPNLRRARVVWLGVEPEARLELLHHDLEVAYSTMGFEIEARPFRPHVTLGRVRQPLSPSASRGLAAAARETVFDEEHAVSSVDLMQSQLSANAERYRTLVVAPLRVS